MDTEVELISRLMSLRNKLARKTGKPGPGKSPLEEIPRLRQQIDEINRQLRELYGY